MLQYFFFILATKIFPEASNAIRESEIIFDEVDCANRLNVVAFPVALSLAKKRPTLVVVTDMVSTYKVFLNAPTMTMFEPAESTSIPKTPVSADDADA